MTQRCVILDFDGTFTDVEVEAGAFIEGYRRDLTERFGTEVGDAWLEAETRIRGAPDAHGWTHGGVIVAPANADPYVRAIAIANILLDERGLVEDAEERSALLDELYARNYQVRMAAFRPEAKEILEVLLASDATIRVISNSHTHAVQAKLEALAPAGRERLVVRGGARKFVVTEPEETDPTFEGLDEHVRLDGLERPIYLKRGHYYEVLRETWDETGATPATTYVVGDIYELDLALPAHLGAKVHLISRDTTPGYEKRAVVERHGGRVSSDLKDLPSLVRE